jgi:hypothetical protein
MQIVVVLNVVAADRRSSLSVRSMVDGRKVHKIGTRCGTKSLDNAIVKACKKVEYIFGQFGFSVSRVIGTIFSTMENVFEFNLNLINKLNFIKRFAQTFPIGTMLNEAGPLITFCK